MQFTWRDFLNLDDKQSKKLSDWLEDVVYPIRKSFLLTLSDDDRDEDCCMSGPVFTVTLSDSGIGPSCCVSYQHPGVKLNCHLAYDDDGQLK